MLELKKEKEIKHSDMVFESPLDKMTCNVRKCTFSHVPCEDTDQPVHSHSHVPSEDTDQPVHSHSHVPIEDTDQPVHSHSRAQ